MALNCQGDGPGKIETAINSFWGFPNTRNWLLRIIDGLHLSYVVVSGLEARQTVR